MPPLNGFLLKFCLKKFEKIELRPYQNVEKFDDVFIRLDILVVPALDRRTDGRTDRIGKTISRSACIIKTAGCHLVHCR